VIDQSFGVIPISFNENNPQVFLVQNKNGAFWGFPKGHAEEKETPKQAALRELKEETALESIGDLFEQPLIEKYSFTHNGFSVKKTVTYFVLETTKESHLEEEEILDGGWFTLEQAKKKLTFPESISLLLKVEDILNN